MDWAALATVVATIAGPILAVQAQKWVERSTDRSRRQEAIFTALMATRQSRIAPDHVQALNSIDLAFYGGRSAKGEVKRSRTDQNVIDSWHTYHKHLSSLPPTPSSAMIDAWTATGNELFVNLLDRLAVATNHQFDRELLNTGGYVPVAHTDTDLAQRANIKLFNEVLQGKRTLPLDIRAFPPTPEPSPPPPPSVVVDKN